MFYSLPMSGPSYSTTLSDKLESLKGRRRPISMGAVSFASPLILAPMSGICNAPFRLLMEELGAGGTVSELISCHGINQGNARTRDMLALHPREKNVAIQIFGEDADAMARGAEVAVQESCKRGGGTPKFIDINMGCPVRKVVSKGGGSALMRDTKLLGKFFATIKKDLPIPLTIKIRTGWDEHSINASEVIKIAASEGIEFVSVHGRTRAQQYRGNANWELLEELAIGSPLAVVGNGDLNSPGKVRHRLNNTTCSALMLGRGPLRNPFIFLTALLDEDEEDPFGPMDYLEVIERYRELVESYNDNEHTILVQVRKMIVWFAHGFRGASKFRAELFCADTLNQVIEMTTQYFCTLSSVLAVKSLDFDRPFMDGGHG